MQGRLITDLRQTPGARRQHSTWLETSAATRLSGPSLHCHREAQPRHLEVGRGGELTGVSMAPDAEHRLGLPALGLLQVPPFRWILRRLSTALRRFPWWSQHMSARGKQCHPPQLTLGRIPWKRSTGRVATGSWSLSSLPLDKAKLAFNNHYHPLCPFGVSLKMSARALKLDCQTVQGRDHALATRTGSHYQDPRNFTSVRLATSRCSVRLVSATCSFLHRSARGKRRLPATLARRLGIVPPG